MWVPLLASSRSGSYRLTAAHIHLYTTILIECRAFGARFFSHTRIPALRPGLRTAGPLGLRSVLGFPLHLGVSAPSWGFRSILGPPLHLGASAPSWGFRSILGPPLRLGVSAPSWGFRSILGPPLHLGVSAPSWGFRSILGPPLHLGASAPSWGLRSVLGFPLRLECMDSRQRHAAALQGAFGARLP